MHLIDLIGVKISLSIEDFIFNREALVNNKTKNIVSLVKTFVFNLPFFNHKAHYLLALGTSRFTTND